jgi:hypothetical protein
MAPHCLKYFLTSSVDQSLSWAGRLSVSTLSARLQSFSVFHTFRRRQKIDNPYDNKRSSALAGDAGQPIYVPCLCRPSSLSFDHLLFVVRTKRNLDPDQIMMHICELIVLLRRFPRFQSLGGDRYCNEVQTMPLDTRIRFSRPLFECPSYPRL